MRRQGMGTIACLVLMMSGPLQAAELPDWSSLQWLAGCWRLNGGEAGSEEHWLVPAGGQMLGVSRIVRKGKVVEFEFMRIHDLDGQRYYTAKPSGQAEASFRLITAEPRLLVFENPEHDFPQRISYQLQEDGSLLAQIAGTRQGKARSVDFPMSRTSCN